jgi:hypothetical protein
MSYCKEIQRDIGAYVDNLLPEAARRSMARHIRSCPDCRKVLSEFEKVRGLLKGLDEVEPPPGFTFRVMAEIRETGAQRRGLLERLFRPLGVKLPIHAIAALLIVVMALYVYKATEPESKVQLLPGVEAGRNIETARPQGKETPAGAEPSTVRPGGGQGKDRREPAPAPEAKAVGGPAKEVEKKADQVPPEGRSIPRREPEALFRLESRAPSPREGPAAPSGADAVLAGKGVVAPPDLSVEVADLSGAIKQAQKIVEGAAGRILRRESAEKKEVFVIEASPERIDELLGRLSALGTRKDRKPAGPKGKEPVVVTVEFLAQP